MIALVGVSCIMSTHAMFIKEREKLACQFHTLSHGQWLLWRGPCSPQTVAVFDTPCCESASTLQILSPSEASPSMDSFGELSSQLLSEPLFSSHNQYVRFSPGVLLLLEGCRSNTNRASLLMDCVCVLLGHYCCHIINDGTVHQGPVQGKIFLSVF